MPLGADHAAQGFRVGEEGAELRGVERPPRAVDEAFDPVFLALGPVVGIPEQLLGPERVLLGAFLVEQAGVEHRGDRHLPEVRCHDPRIGVQ